MITEKDTNLLKSKGIDIVKVNQQLQQFIDGFPFMDIQKPATLSDGIIALDEEKKLMFTDQYRKGIDEGLEILKFVPASGAATRMFKSLFAFINAEETEQEKMKIEGPIHDLLININHFAFSEDLEKATNISFLSQDEVMKNAHLIVSKLLLSDGLNYGNFPKGVLKFHVNELSKTTPIEEHLIEGAMYGQDNEGIVNIHFTVSEEHRTLFENIIKEKLPVFEAKYNVDYNITYSTQKKSTDTIAVTPENKPFRQDNDEILFRPGGHGALIENLNELDADIIFIKNIDNVVPSYRLKDTIQFKEALGGVLYFYQQKIFEYLELIDEKGKDKELFEEILDFMQVELFIPVPESIQTSPLDKIESFIINKLNRPIRVCGMVRNLGEPGGGPFWATGKYGDLSLQIVESSQIDLKDKDKANIMKESTHFNPVDLICGIKNYKGDKFNLLDYTDPKTGFISHKSLGGNELKALELPGLWNGAMSDWTTLFVEVPITTFNPVKTINDLLRTEHQPVEVEQH